MLTFTQHGACKKTKCERLALVIALVVASTIVLSLESHAAAASTALARPVGASDLGHGDHDAPALTPSTTERASERATERAAELAAERAAAYRPCRLP